MDQDKAKSFPVVEKSIKPALIEDEPKLELKRTGHDLTDHEGIEWIYLLCPHCNVYAKFTPQFTIIISKPESKGVQPRDFHTLAECEHCGDVIYVKCWEIDFDPDWWFAYEYHHPRTNFVHSTEELPPLVFASFSEAHKCLQAGAYLATLVMCRRTIEALLAERGVDKKLNLAKAIQKVADDSTLHESMVEVADLVRLLGNIGVHADDEYQITKEQAEEAYSLTEKLLEMIYILPSRTQKSKEKLEELRAKRSGKIDKLG
jgi:hypothetical protein